MITKLQSLCIIILLILCAGITQAKPPIYMQVKVYYNTPAELTQLRLMHLDIVKTEEDHVDVVAFQEDFDEITQNGFEIDIIHEDLTKYYQSQLDPTRDMGGYKTLSEINAYVDQMVIDHPDIISSKIDIGLTLEGRTMWAVKISDNPEVDEDEPEVLFTSAIHAREVVTPEVLFATMDYLTDGYNSDPRATYLVNNRELWFIPMINPDGYYHNEVIAPGGGGMWRKNRRDNGDGTWGVDLNRNFGYMWGYDSEGSSGVKGDEDYRGSSPFSEPESQNIRDFTIAHNFIITLNFHSIATCIGYAYGYNSSASPEHSTFSRLSDVMCTFNDYFHNHLYTINGCQEDWGYGEQTLKNKNYSFMIETGYYETGFWPALEYIPQILSENVPICLLAAGVADRIKDNYESSPGIAEIVLDNPVECAEYTVAWNLTEDPDNPTMGCEITECLITEGETDLGENLGTYSSQIFTINSDRFYSAPSCYFSGHINNQESYLQTIIPYKVRPGDAIEFHTYYDIQTNYDYAYVEISIDGENFTPIEGNITTNYNPYGKNRGNGITGNSGDWIEGIFDLSDFVDQEINYKLSYYADQSISGEGIFIDDITPIDLFSENIITNVQPTGEYTFTEHESGRYFYKIRCADIDGQWGPISENEFTYVRPAFICGDIDGDESINILDIVFLINYKYKDGPTPEILEACDVDSDAKVNILDVVYLINFKYKDGPDPDCP